MYNQRKKLSVLQVGNKTFQVSNTSCNIVQTDRQTDRHRCRKAKVVCLEKFHQSKTNRKEYKNYELFSTLPPKRVKKLFLT